MLYSALLLNPTNLGTAIAPRIPRIATITINSTVGLSSLYHGIPTLTLGKAIYDIDGLTCKGMKLDEFWTKNKKPDELLFKKFRTFLIQNTSIRTRKK